VVVVTGDITGRVVKVLPEKGKGEDDFATLPVWEAQMPENRLLSMPLIGGREIILLRYSVLTSGLVIDY